MAKPYIRKATFEAFCMKCKHSWAESGKKPCPLCGAKYNVNYVKRVR